MWDSKAYYKQYNSNRKETRKIWLKQHVKKYPWIKTLRGIQSKCTSKTRKYYKRGIKNLITKENLKYLWFRDKGWLLKEPSIDRINNNGNYELSNCRYMEKRENSRIGNLGNTPWNKGRYKDNVKPETLKIRIRKERKYESQNV